MTTYNTYQEAKIANPESDVFTNTDNDRFKSKSDDRFFIRCIPQQHCMTVEKFLADGNKFVEGDLIIGTTGNFVFVGVDYTVYTANIKSTGDSKRYILRAAVLEEKIETESEYDKGMRDAMKKIAVSCGRVFGADIGYEDLPELVDTLINPPQKKPRTKVEYVKAEFDSAWEAVKDFEDGKKLYTKRSHKDYILIDNAPDVLRFLYDLHKRIETETEIDEREEFIDALNDSFHSHTMSTSDLFNAIVDSGKFKLVN